LKFLSHKESRTEKNTKYFIGTGNIDLEGLIFKEKQITKQKENLRKKKVIQKLPFCIFNCALIGQPLCSALLQAALVCCGAPFS